ncbi:DedA family protein [Pseudoruegeria sp. SK021]|uniref:DedA family protein n=1 Tax=Pseudoruegeria sp. SK021 TaxID=1933035 RepID=UPI000A227C47|nr:VTT domain-containing protein [Pseudoruegeria sp. SK021]OSP54165.1 hypothetical protein BV911_14005 [Pseudoruegeria sp. SK021]
MSASTDAILQLLQSHGLALLFPLAVLEGPIVSVIAGWLTRLGYFAFPWAFVVLVLADLIGDAGMYWLGRSGLQVLPDRWRRRLRIDEPRIEPLAAHFQTRGGRTLILAKITHSLGFAALIAAGAGRMPFGSFLWFNLLGTLPKTLFFLMIGYALGQAHAEIDTWIWRGSAIMAGLATIAVIAWLFWRKRRHA